MNLKSWYTNLQQKPLNRCQQVQVPYKWPKTKIKPTNWLLTTKDRCLKLTNDRWQTKHESCIHYHKGFTDQSLLTDETGNTIDWQALFTTTQTCYSQKKNNSCTPCVPMLVLLLSKVHKQRQITQLLLKMVDMCRKIKLFSLYASDNRPILIYRNSA